MADEFHSDTDLMNNSEDSNDDRSDSGREDSRKTASTNVMHFPSRGSTFLCKICADYVQGGVITICGHLYCWTCLWPKLCHRQRPRCPCCSRRLVLHEDIVPFLSDGPFASPDDGIIYAQPGNVPRPTGMYLINQKYPRWFVVNVPEEDEVSQRNLLTIIDEMNRRFPRVMYWTRFLQRFELVCILLMIAIGIFILTILDGFVEFFRPLTLK